MQLREIRSNNPSAFPKPRVHGRVKRMAIKPANAGLLRRCHYYHMNVHFRLVAESKGFEPLVPCGTTVFKTAAFDHSASSPKIGYHILLIREKSFPIQHEAHSTFRTHPSSFWATTRHPVIKHPMSNSPLGRGGRQRLFLQFPSREGWQATPDGVGSSDSVTP